MAKIVFINRFFYPDESATSQILTDLAAHLRQKGSDVLVITSRTSLQGKNKLRGRETVLGGVEVRRVGRDTVARRSTGAKLAQLIAFYPAALVELLRTVSGDDVIVAKTDPPLVSVIAWIVARLRRAQLVNWLQDVYPEVAANLGTPVLRGAVGHWLKLLRNMSLKGAVANVVIGEVMAAKLEREGVPAKKIRVIPNWADESALRPIRTEESAARKEWGFGRADFILGYSGNLGRAHEFDTLLAAAALLSGRSDIKFLFTGGGQGYDRLRSAAEKQRLKSFTFRAHQPREKLQDVLGAADVHWLSLRPELEGLIVPSKLYGILAAGRPVLAVTSANGEVAKVVRENECGLAVEPGDVSGLANAIVALADDAKLRRAKGARAREVSERLLPRSAALRSWTELLRSLERS